MSEKQIEKLQPLVYDITDPGYREADAQDLADVGTEVVVSYDAVQARIAALEQEIERKNYLLCAAEIREIQALRKKNSMQRKETRGQ